MYASPQFCIASKIGEIFDSSVHKITHVIGEGKVTIGGIDFIIKQTAEAFDIEIPEINAVYTHMLGHDCHSIVAGTGHADAFKAEVGRQYPQYSGRNYLDMTAGFFA